MNPCPQFEGLLLEQATGELQGEALQKLEEHLSECPGCAAEAKSLNELLELSSLPPQSAEERVAISALPVLTAAAWRRAERTRTLLQGATVGFLAAVSAAALIFLPGSRPTPLSSAVEIDPTVAAVQGWASPSPFHGIFPEPFPEDGGWDLEEDG
jgi:anti-sigma factor RsiW